MVTKFRGVIILHVIKSNRYIMYKACETRAVKCLYFVNNPCRPLGYKTFLALCYTLMAFGTLKFSYHWTISRMEQAYELQHSETSSATPSITEHPVLGSTAQDETRVVLSASGDRNDSADTPHEKNVSEPLREPWPFSYSFRDKTGIEFSVDKNVLASLGLPPTKFTNLSHTTKDDIVFVTANSWTHYIEGLDAVASVQANFPKAKILYYDWGLAEWQIKRIKTMCNVELRDFNISQFNIPNLNETRVKYQILKPLLIATVLREFPALIYMDSSVRFLNGSLTHIQNVAMQNGGIVMLTGSPDSIYSITDYGMYKYLPSDIEALKTVHCLQSGALLVYNTEVVFRNVLWWWYMCALEMPCVAPVDNLECIEVSDRMLDHRGCHRYDQSALNILVANLYEFKMLTYHFPQQIMPQLLNVWRHPTRMYNITYCPTEHH